MDKKKEWKTPELRCFGTVKDITEGQACTTTVPNKICGVNDAVNHDVDPRAIGS